MLGGGSGGGRDSAPLRLRVPENVLPGGGTPKYGAGDAHAVHRLEVLAAAHRHALLPVGALRQHEHGAVDRVLLRVLLRRRELGARLRGDVVSCKGRDGVGHARGVRRWQRTSACSAAAHRSGPASGK